MGIYRIPILVTTQNPSFDNEMIEMGIHLFPSWKIWEYIHSHLGIIMVNYGISIWEYTHSHLGIIMVIMIWEYTHSHLGIIMVIMIWEYTHSHLGIIWYFNMGIHRFPSWNYNGNYCISIWEYTHSHLGIIMVIMVFQYGNTPIPILEL